MALSWNEIKKRAIEFSKSWEGVEREKAEAQTFWNEFFEVFGQTRRKVAILEQEVKRLDESKGFIDLFWPKVLLAEAKSRGKNLVKAKEQAISYLHGIEDSELPKYILTSDFENLALLDLESGESEQFKVSKLHENINLFSFIAGYSKTDFKAEDPVNIKAAELMGALHDSLFDAGFTGHSLEVFLVRVLFCLFADDTGIFNKGIFSNYILNKTRVDGSDVGPQLAQLFQLLDTPDEKRLKNLDEDLAKFPYVNGKLFEEVIPMTSFDSTMRNALISCCNFNWKAISPAVFGSLFQSVMDQKERRNLGAHYTSEENILKVIRPLFLDDLWAEFAKAKNNKDKLNDFHSKLSRLKFLDPACGCGNFLVITYRELRLLELEVLKKIHEDQIKAGMLGLNLGEYLKLNVDQFYGIEIEEFPARIAEVAMWLVDHQMNIKLSEELGHYYVRLPLRKSANIVNGNALRLNWEDILPKNELSYILGNPPFVGHQWRNSEQKNDLDTAFNGLSSKSGRLDFVSAWFLLAAKYIQNTQIKVAFVSTNSITQGEQAEILWRILVNRFKISIFFAHRTFQWNSESKGKAAVHVVIIGFANYEVKPKCIFEYEKVQGISHKLIVSNITQYLTEGSVVFIESRGKLKSKLQPLFKGSQPTDGGYLILTELEKEQLVSRNPIIAKWIRQFIGGYELMNSTIRYCLWLKDCPPEELKKMPEIIERLDMVRKSRLLSSTPSVNRFSDYPSLFTQDRQPNVIYLALPRVSSSARVYIPMVFMSPDIIAHEKLIIIPSASIFLFGLLTSMMHMSWVRQTGGRLKSDYSYSPQIYNNFPWPENVSNSQKKLVEQKAQQVLDVRKEFPDSTLADLYNPLTMPPKLLKAHKNLDSAVDKAYRAKPFKDERERIEFLFERYEELVKKVESLK